MSLWSKFVEWWRGSSVSRSGFKAPKEIRMTWKIVKVEGPIHDDLGLPDFGVIVSSDTMLEQAQTLLFCPLFTGDDAPEQLLPWHVKVVPEKKDNSAFTSSFGILSTKLVFPISLNEIDRDGRDRGRIDRPSRQGVAKVLGNWLPLFTDPA